MKSASFSLLASTTLILLFRLSYGAVARLEVGKGAKDVQHYHCDVCFSESVVDNCHEILDECNKPTSERDLDYAASLYEPLMSESVVKNDDLACWGLYSLFVLEKLETCELHFTAENPVRKDLVLGGLSYVFRRSLGKKKNFGGFSGTDCEGWEILHDFDPETLKPKVRLLRSHPSRKKRTTGSITSRTSAGTISAKSSLALPGLAARPPQPVCLHCGNSREYVGRSTFWNTRISNDKAIKKILRKTWKRNLYSFRQYFGRNKNFFEVERTVVRNRVVIQVTFRVRDFTYDGEGVLR